MLFTQSDKLTLRQFIGPYLLAFFVVEFVLIMQFLWKYIDNILGKGYGFFNYLELIGYMSVTLIPLALPLTILLSSVMVYGDMSEHFELTSLKSAGVSLLRILRPGIAVGLFTVIFSLVASNYLKPNAADAFWRKFNNMYRSKIAFTLDEKVFNDEFKYHSIYVDSKSKDEKWLYDVLINIEHFSEKNLMSVLRAEKAKMEVSDDGRYLVMELYNGNQYTEYKDANSKANYRIKPDRNLPFSVVHFKKYKKVFDLADIYDDISHMSFDRKKHETLNSLELIHHIDSLSVDADKLLNKSLNSFNEIVDLPTRDDLLILQTWEKDGISDKRDTTKPQNPIQKITKEKEKKTAKFDKIGKLNMVEHKKVISASKSVTDESSIIALIDKDEQERILRNTIKRQSSKSYNTLNLKIKMKNILRNKNFYMWALHNQVSWAVICILFLFIGSSMGAIVRKGGFGYPMLTAIGFYMSFIILTIIGEKLLQTNNINGIIASWIPVFALLPFTILLTYMALNDMKMSMFKLDLKFWK